MMMKRSSLFLGLMVVSTIMFAQGKMDPVERSARQADKMKTELALDDVQSKAVKAINEEFALKFSNVRRDSTLSKDEKQKKMRNLHQEKDAAIGKILTPEQKEKWASQRAARTNKHRAHMGRHHGDRAMRMQEKLSLSDDQASKIKAIDKEFGEKFRALRSDSTLAHEDTREKAKMLRQEHHSKTKSVLTEEQFKKWEEQKSERKRKRF
jgi:Spy/CpxP family protein refolding chaperone